MFTRYNHYSKYCCSYTMKTIFKDIYGAHNSKNGYSFEYNFLYNRLTKREYLVIHSNYPGIFIGKNGDNIHKVEEAYKNINPKCMGVKVYETTRFYF